MLIAENKPFMLSVVMLNVGAPFIIYGTSCFLYFMSGPNNL